MRRFRTAATCTAFILVLLGRTADALACANGTAYSLNPSVLPTANWTNSSGAVWLPAGGYPGCGTNDSAVMGSTPATPPTLTINSGLNALSAFTLSCSGCTIDLQSGGQLPMAGPASAATGTSIQVNGGSLIIANGGSLTMQSGSTFLETSGSVDVQTGGQLTLPDSVTSTIGGTFSLS